MYAVSCAGVVFGPTSGASPSVAVRVVDEVVVG
jgi:hypothetical protein